MGYARAAVGTTVEVHALAVNWGTLPRPPGLERRP
jgi:hypothetical protein